MQLANGTRVILDAGTGLRVLGQRWPAGTQSGAVIPVLLTHRHSDHVIGLSHFAPLISRTHAVRIACADVDDEALRSFIHQQLSAPLFPTLDGITDAVTIASFDVGGSLALGPFCHVQALAARHPGGAAVLRVHDEHGPVLAFAPDNELSMTNDAPDVFEWRESLEIALRGVPVLLHDATFTNEELDAHRGWGHSSVEEATEFAMRCDVGTLLLTHHHPDRSDDEIDNLVERCSEIARRGGSSLRVVAAADGMVLDIG